MKNILLLIFSIVVFASCNSNNNNNNVNPAKVYYSVPNWQTDTLIGVWQTGAITNRDTIYSFTANSKSYIKYKGIQYEVKAYMFNNASFQQNAQHYLADIFTMNGAQLNTVYTDGAEPGKYYDNAFSTWKVNYQSIQAKHPPFSDSVVGGLYSTVYK